MFIKMKRGMNEYYQTKYIALLIGLVVFCYFFTFHFLRGLKTESYQSPYKSAVEKHAYKFSDDHDFDTGVRGWAHLEEQKLPKWQPNVVENLDFERDILQDVKPEKSKFEQRILSDLVKPEKEEKKEIEVLKDSTGGIYGQNDKFVNITAIRDSNLIMVGGFGRSGTTLMRAILDVHPNIQCGPETRILVKLLGSLKGYLTTGQRKVLFNAGINNQTIDESIAMFMYHIITNHVPQTKRYCMKDPYTFNQLKYLYHLFPKTKFIYMVRDGRGNAHSYIYKSNETSTTENFKYYLKWWNDFNIRAYSQCVDLGPKICLRVNYEDVITKSNQTIRNIINFLGEPWSDGLLKHHEFIGSEVAVSKTEWSTNQIDKPLYKDSLTGWLEKIPYVEESELRKLAPMIEYFGYNLTVNATIIAKQKEVARLAEIEEAKLSELETVKSAKLPKSKASKPKVVDDDQ